MPRLNKEMDKRELRKMIAEEINKQTKEIIERSYSIKSNDDYRHLMNQLKELRLLWERIMRVTE